jgi:hypothetical protein
VHAVRRHDQRLARIDGQPLPAHTHLGFAFAHGQHFLDRVRMRRRAGARRDPLFEDAQLRRTAAGLNQHAGFHAQPPLFGRHIPDVDHDH